MDNIYNFFDDIVCINYDSSQIDNLNIPARFLTIQKDIYGCFDYHIKILKEAYENNVNYLLVFEDNILPTDSYNIENIKIAIDFMKNNKDWDVFYLGYFSVSYNFKLLNIDSIFNSTIINKNIIKHNPYSTHAICYNKNSIKTILDTYEDYIGIVDYDVFLANLNNYCSIPMLFQKKDNNMFINYINYQLSLLLYDITDRKYDKFLLIISIMVFYIIKFKINLIVNNNRKDLLLRCVNCNTDIVKFLSKFI